MTSLFDITHNRHRGNAESQSANLRVASSKEKMRAQVLEAIQRSGARGMTCDELETLLGLTHQTCSARCSELKKDGMVQKLGTRPTRTGSPAAVLVSRDSGESVA